MNPKVVKINAELDKNSAKIARLQARNKELERQRTELENTDIIGLVRNVGLTPDQLAELIKGMNPVVQNPENAAPENVESAADTETDNDTDNGEAWERDGEEASAYAED